MNNSWKMLVFFVPKYIVSKQATEPIKKDFISSSWDQEFSIYRIRDMPIAICLYTSFPKRWIGSERW